MLYKSADTRPMPFLLVSSSDKTSPVTGATVGSITIKLSENGASFNTLTSPTIAELGNGWYIWTPLSTDLNTLGFAAINITYAGAEPVDLLVQVVAFDPYAVTNLGLTNLSNAVPTTAQITSAITSTNVPQIVNGGPIDTTGGLINGVLLVYTLDESAVAQITTSLGSSFGSIQSSITSLTGITRTGFHAILRSDFDLTYGAGEALEATWINAPLYDEGPAGSYDPTQHSLPVNPEVFVGGFADGAIQASAFDAGAITAIQNGLALQATLLGGFANLSAVKAKTDQLTFTNNNVHAHVKVSDVDSGIGAYVVTITTSPTLAGVTVRVDGMTQETDSNGEAVFALDAGAYTVSATKSNYMHTPETILVTTTETFTIELTAINISPSMSLDYSTGYLFCFDEAGNVAANVRVDLKMLKTSQPTNYAFDATVRTVKSDEFGLAQFTNLVRGDTYSVRRGNGDWVTFTVPDENSFELPSIKGSP
jgi:hypothetical protein